MFNKIKPINVLMAEDNPGDIRLTEEAIKECNLQINLHVVMDGEEAMAFLRKQGKFTNTPIPDLILLDLNMPKKDGRQVLKEIKEDENLKIIPVAVLTISKSDDDIQLAYKQHVNCYITKPLDLDQFIEVIKSIHNFWFSTVTLPRKTT